MPTGDERTAVVAHDLLNRMTVVAGAIDLALRQPDLPATTTELLLAGKRQAAVVAAALRDLVQGQPGGGGSGEAVAGSGVTVEGVDLDQG